MPALLVAVASLGLPALADDRQEGGAVPVVMLSINPEVQFLRRPPLGLGGSADIGLRSEPWQLTFGVRIDWYPHLVQEALASRGASHEVRGVSVRIGNGWDFGRVVQIMGFAGVGLDQLLVRDPSLETAARRSVVYVMSYHRAGVRLGKPTVVFVEVAMRSPALEPLNEVPIVSAGLGLAWTFHGRSGPPSSLSVPSR